MDGVYSFWGKQQSLPNFLDYQPVMSPSSCYLKKRVLFGVVATRETKKWPLEHYKKLAELIYSHHPSLEIVIPLSTSVPDIKIKEEIKKLNFPANTSVVHWPLNQLANEFSGSLCYIGNDTGIKHLAIAVGLKTVTFFGAEPPNEWHPYNLETQKYFYRENLSCRTRTHHYCGLQVCDLKDSEYNQCLTKLYPEQIYQEIKLLF